MPGLKPVEISLEKDGRRAADDLFREFEEKIRSGELREGDTLPPEREIVESFGVSRTVVREAILSLSNKGLVDAKPRYRPVVRKLNFDTAFETMGSVVERLLELPNGVENLFGTRTLVEVSLVRQAAVEANREQISALKQALVDNEAAIEDSALFYKTDMVFHSILYETSGNPLLPSIHRAYMTWLEPYWSKMPRLPDRNRVNYESHKSIYEAILMRDPDDAEKAMRKHLDDAWNQVKKTFQDTA